MDIWFEYAFSISGETLTVEVRFYTSDVAADPIITDQWSYVLTKEPLSVDRLRNRLYNRVREIEQGLTTYNAINAALGAGQNTRLNAEDVVGG